MNEKKILASFLPDINIFTLPKLNILNGKWSDLLPSSVSCCVEPLKIEWRDSFSFLSFHTRNDEFCFFSIYSPQFLAEQLSIGMYMWTHQNTRIYKCKRFSSPIHGILACIKWWCRIFWIISWNVSVSANRFWTMQRSHFGLMSMTTRWFNNIFWFKLISYVPFLPYAQKLKCTGEIVHQKWSWMKIQRYNVCFCAHTHTHACIRTNHSNGYIWEKFNFLPLNGLHTA